MINSQLLLYLNLGFGLLLVAYFILGRPKPKPPTKLNMKAPDSEDAAKQKKQQVLEPEVASQTPMVAEPSIPVQPRDLSVIFMYNGHDWEAHEVLGVPQGASMHAITVAYQKLVKTGDPRSLQFYELAYAAISNRHRKHRL